MLARMAKHTGLEPKVLSEGSPTKLLHLTPKIFRICWACGPQSLRPGARLTLHLTR